MEKLNPREINTTALAFMGDAVYEILVRKYVMESGQQGADMLHKAAVRYVRAESQAAAVKSLMQDFLTEEETALVKRARNHKGVSKARSAGPVAYKLATAFEALMGFLYLDGQQARLAEIGAEAICRIEAARRSEQKKRRESSRCSEEQKPKQAEKRADVADTAAAVAPQNAATTQETAASKNAAAPQEASSETASESTEPQISAAAPQEKGGEV